jgi:hypothetical protein
MDTTTPTYCANHPRVETSLRCNRCGKLICAQCAIQTPTGYRCAECLRGQQKVFITAEWVDYLFGFLVAFVLGLIASILASLAGGLGFIGWFAIFLGAPTAGIAIAEAARKVTRRHRARSLYLTILAGVVLAALPLILINILRFNLFALIFQGIYLFLAVPVVYTRLSGIRLNR